MKNINRVFNVIDNSLFRITGNLDYWRLTDAIIRLSELIRDYDGDTEDIWYIGEYGECCLSDLIVGAYWHYTEWHGGQSSQGYRALSALGQIFDPGMSSPDDEQENAAYLELDLLAGEYFRNTR
jgi:hypothetical protein